MRPTPSRRALHAAVAVGLLLTTAACTVFRPQAQWVSIRAAPPPVGRPLLADEAEYSDAVVAIGARDYAHALDLLQAARARKPDDARVLNAFGVVYDKLDRFDLSARYYAEAKALDPTSTVVANNLAYSQFLRGKAETSVKAAARLPSSPALLERVVLPPPVLASGIFFGSPQGPMLDIRPAPAPRRALVLINASGRLNGAQPIRVALARLGWSEAPLVGEAPHRTWTTISYPEGYRARAAALAASVPLGARLVACPACDRLHLVVGSQVADLTARADFRSLTRPKVG